MEKQDILKAILSKDATKLAEAKTAIKELLNARAAQFRQDSSKFVAKSLFESADQLDVLAVLDESEYKEHPIIKHANEFSQRKITAKTVEKHHGKEAADHIKAWHDERKKMNKAYYGKGGNEENILASVPHEQKAEEHLQNAMKASDKHRGV